MPVSTFSSGDFSGTEGPTEESTAAFLQEMGFAVVPDCYKGRIIGLTLGNPRDDAATTMRA